MNDYLERFYGDVFPIRCNYFCNFCGYIGEAKEMKNDPELGWIHWKCLESYEKMEKQEQRFKWELEQSKSNGGSK